MKHNEKFDGILHSKNELMFFFRLAKGFDRARIINSNENVEQIRHPNWIVAFYPKKKHTRGSYALL